MTLREKVIAILNEEICSGADRAYGLDQKVADDIIPIILAEAAEALRAEFRPGGHYGGAYADMAETFVAAIEQLGER